MSEIHKFCVRLNTVLFEKMSLGYYFRITGISVNDGQEIIFLKLPCAPGIIFEKLPQAPGKPHTPDTLLCSKLSQQRPFTYVSK